MSELKSTSVVTPPELFAQTRGRLAGAFGVVTKRHACAVACFCCMGDARKTALDHLTSAHTDNYYQQLIRRPSGEEGASAFRLLTNI